jgi:hypothetical protein
MADQPTLQEAADNPAGDTAAAVAKVVTDLHIARRNLSIYPPTHEQAKQSVQKAYAGLVEVLEHCKSFTLAVMKDGLVLDGTLLPANQQIQKEFAQILKQYQVAALTFEKDLDESELIRFLLLLGADREEVNDQGGIEAAAEACNLSRIGLTAVDYSKLQLTEELEIQRSDVKDRQPSIWQQFVSQIVSNQAGSSIQSDVDPNALKRPEELAELLNRKEIDVHQALQLYDEILAAVMHDRGGDELQQQGLRDFQAMIRKLVPDLRKDFLSTTLKSCSAVETEDDTAHLVEGLGADLIVQMIRQADADGQAISQSLRSFVKKMGHLKIAPDLMTDTSDTGNRELSTEQISSLMAQEEYDHFVDEEYGILLDSLAADDQRIDSGPAVQNLSEQLAESLDVSNIHSQVSRALSGLMAQSPDSEDYRGWARQLSYILGDLLDTQAYDSLTETLAFVRSEKENPDRQKAKLADIVWQHFSGPEFVAKAVKRVLKSQGEAADSGYLFLQKLGEPVVVEILDLLSTGETDIDRKVLLQSLDRFGPLAAREAVERLNDSRMKYLRMMIQIVRRLGDSQSAEQLRSLLEHDSIDIRMEALSTLLRFKNKWGLIHLRELIEAPWSDLTRQAIALAGTNKVKDVVPTLIAFVQRRGDARRQEASLRALGQIGDSRAIPVIGKLARRRWTLSQKHRRHLQSVIYESLEGYADAGITDLLHYGIKQDNDYIRHLCEVRLRKIRMVNRS